MKTLSPKHRGFSLVELMIAITISIVLITGLIQVYISAKRSYLIQDSIARMQENGRYALNLINKDLRLAGYMGGNADPSIISGIADNPDGLCGSLNDNRWGRMVERGVFGLNDNLTGYAGCIDALGSPAADGDYLSGDVLTVRYSRQTNLTATDMTNDRGLLLKSSPFNGEIRLVASRQEIVDNNNNFSNLTDTPITYSWLEAYSYYSGAQTADCDGIQVPVPALYRLALDVNGTPTREEVIRGVENLQVQYGVNTNNDGVIDQYLDANNVTDWSQVRAVRYWLLIRDECPGAGGYLNNNTYVMGDSNLDLSTPGNGDRFRRQLYTNTVMLRNNEVI